MPQACGARHVPSITPSPTRPARLPATEPTISRCRRPYGPADTRRRAERPERAALPLPCARRVELAVGKAHGSGAQRMDPVCRVVRRYSGVVLAAGSYSASRASAVSTVSYRRRMSSRSAFSGTERSAARWIMAAWSSRTWRCPLPDVSAMIFASASSWRIITAGMPSLALWLFSPARVAPPPGRAGRPHRGEPVPPDEEMPGPVVQGDDRVRLGSELDQGPVPDELQVAARGRPDHATVFGHAGDQSRR